MGWLRKLFGTEESDFENTGTTKREKNVARLLNRKIPRSHFGKTVRRVRFAWVRGGGQPDRITVSVDIYNGDVIDGGQLKLEEVKEMTAKQQAQAIYEYMNDMKLIQKYLRRL